MVSRITQQRLKELLCYDVQTGVFVWRASRRGVKAGAVAGTKNGGGYRQICLDGCIYGAHSLAWLYVHGVYPAQLDHEDTNRLNNAIKNLRLATHSQNGANRPARTRNRSGHKGVTLHCGRWRVRVTHYSVEYSGGRYKSYCEACAAQEKLERHLQGIFAYKASME